MKRLALALFLIFSQLGTASAGWDEAWAAYQRGDYETAAREYRLLAEQGDANAQSIFGGMYYSGRGVPKDHGEAVKWWRKAAEQGHAQAQYNLGRMYHKGQGVPQDYTEAVRYQPPRHRGL